MWCSPDKLTGGRDQHGGQQQERSMDGRQQQEQGIDGEPVQ